MLPAGGHGEIVFDPPFTSSPKVFFSIFGSATDIIGAYKVVTVTPEKAEILGLIISEQGISLPQNTTGVFWFAYSG